MYTFSLYELQAFMLVVGSIRFLIQMAIKWSYQNRDFVTDGYTFRSLILISVLYRHRRKGMESEVKLFLETHVYHHSTRH